MKLGKSYISQRVKILTSTHPSRKISSPKRLSKPSLYSSSIMRRLCSIFFLLIQVLYKERIYHDFLIKTITTKSLSSLYPITTINIIARTHLIFCESSPFINNSPIIRRREQQLSQLSMCTYQLDVLESIPGPHYLSVPSSLGPIYPLTKKNLLYYQP